MYHIDLHREEVRGVFVLGIVATLFLAKDYLSFKFPYGSTLFTEYVNSLILFWLVYAFLMAIAVSDDIFSETAIRICIAGGQTCFQCGIMYLFGGLLIFGFAYLFSTFLPADNRLWTISSIPSLILFIVVFRKCLKR